MLNESIGRIIKKFQETVSVEDQESKKYCCSGRSQKMLLVQLTIDNLDYSLRSIPSDDNRISMAWINEYCFREHLVSRDGTIHLLIQEFSRWIISRKGDVN